MHRRSPGTLGRAVVGGLCLPTDHVGHVVYNAGPMAGTRYTVRRADCLDEDKMPALGIIIAKSSSTECFIQTEGPIRGVYAGLEQGRTYLVGQDGDLARFVVDPPPGGQSLVELIGIATSDTELWLQGMPRERKIRRAV